MRRSLLPFFSLASVLLLAAGLLSPILDHHFAERFPDHSHLVLSDPAHLLSAAETAPHFHLYQLAHSHTQDTGLPVYHPETDLGARAVMLCIPSEEVEGAQFTLATPWVTSPAGLPLPGIFTSGREPPCLAPQAHIVFPPERPPIAA